MTIPTMDVALKKISESIERKKGSFELSLCPDSPAAFALSAGSYRAVKVPDGFIVSIRLSRDQVEYLKRQCEEALARGALPERGDS
jgi:hypothetical protein